MDFDFLSRSAIYFIQAPDDTTWNLMIGALDS